MAKNDYVCSSLVKIYNSPKNLKFVARYLACSIGQGTYCYFQDDDWIVPYMRSFYANFLRYPYLIHTITNQWVYSLTNWKWKFSNKGMHHSRIFYLMSLFRYQHAYRILLGGYWSVCFKGDCSNVPQLGRLGGFGQERISIRRYVLYDIHEPCSLSNRVRTDRAPTRSCIFWPSKWDRQKQVSYGEVIKYACHY